MPPPLPATTSSILDRHNELPRGGHRRRRGVPGPGAGADGDHGDRRPGRCPHGFAGLPKLRRPLPPPQGGGGPGRLHPAAGGGRPGGDEGRGHRGEGEHRRPARRVCAARPGPAGRRPGPGPPRPGPPPPGWGRPTAGRRLQAGGRAAPPLTSLPPICRRAPSRTENGWSSFPRPSATSGAGSRINPNSPSPGALLNAGAGRA